MKNRAFYGDGNFAFAKCRGIAQGRKVGMAQGAQFGFEIILPNNFNVTNMGKIILLLVLESAIE